MRKLIIVFLILSFILPADISYADCKVIVESNEISYNSYTGKPFINVDGYLMVPIKTTLNLLGADVYWDEGSKTEVINYNGIILRIPVEGQYFYKGDQLIPLGTRSEIINNRFYIPLRPIIKALGGNITVSNKNNTVEVTMASMMDEIDELLHLDFEALKSSNKNIGSVDGKWRYDRMAISARYRNPPAFEYEKVLNIYFGKKMTITAYGYRKDLTVNKNCITMDDLVQITHLVPGGISKTYKNGILTDYMDLQILSRNRINFSIYGKTYTGEYAFIDKDTLAYRVEVNANYAAKYYVSILKRIKN